MGRGGGGDDDENVGATGAGVAATTAGIVASTVATTSKQDPPSEQQLQPKSKVSTPRGSFFASAFECGADTGTVDSSSNNSHSGGGMNTINILPTNPCQPMMSIMSSTKSSAVNTSNDNTIAADDAGELMYYDDHFAIKFLDVRISFSCCSALFCVLGGDTCA